MIEKANHLELVTKMVPRYLAGCQAVARIIRTGKVMDGDANHISEVKGMFNRIARHDQPDWRAVQRLFNMPDRNESGFSAAWLNHLRQLIRARRDIKPFIASEFAPFILMATEAAVSELTEMRPFRAVGQREPVDE